MYIIAIAWLYVTVLMAAAESSITAGVLTFTFYGLIPCSLLLWILGVKHRHYKRGLNKPDNDTDEAERLLLDENVDQPDSRNTKANE
jgi:hypothetical protein